MSTTQSANDRKNLKRTRDRQQKAIDKAAQEEEVRRLQIEDLQKEDNASRKEAKLVEWNARLARAEADDLEGHEASDEKLARAAREDRLLRIDAVNEHQRDSLFKWCPECDNSMTPTPGFKDSGDYWRCLLHDPKDPEVRVPSQSSLYFLHQVEDQSDLKVFGRETIFYSFIEGNKSMLDAHFMTYPSIPSNQKEIHPLCNVCPYCMKTSFDERTPTTTTVKSFQLPMHGKSTHIPIRCACMKCRRIWDPRGKQNDVSMKFIAWNKLIKDEVEFYLHAFPQTLKGESVKPVVVGPKPVPDLSIVECLKLFIFPLKRH